jgi:hypothetical protein
MAIIFWCNLIYSVLADRKKAKLVPQTLSFTLRDKRVTSVAGAAETGQWICYSSRMTINLTIKCLQRDRYGAGRICRPPPGELATPHRTRLGDGALRRLIPVVHVDVLRRLALAICGRRSRSSTR